MDPIFINVFNLHFMAVGLGIARPRQGVMQERSRQPFRKSKDHSERYWGKRRLAFILEEKTRRGINFCSNLGPQASSLHSCQEGFE